MTAAQQRQQLHACPPPSGCGVALLQSTPPGGPQGSGPKSQPPPSTGRQTRCFTGCEIPDTNRQVRQTAGRRGVFSSAAIMVQLFVGSLMHRHHFVACCVCIMRTALYSIVCNARCVLLRASQVPGWDGVEGGVLCDPACVLTCMQRCWLCVSHLQEAVNSHVVMMRFSMVQHFRNGFLFLQVACQPLISAGGRVLL